MQIQALTKPLKFTLLSELGLTKRTQSNADRQKCISTRGVTDKAGEAVPGTSHQTASSSSRLLLMLGWELI